MAASLQPGRRSRWKLSVEGRRRCRDGRRNAWQDEEKRKQAIQKISQAVRLAWQDPEKRKRMAEANARKSADPKYRHRMSEAQRLALSDPEKRKRRSEGPRQARLKERSILQMAKIAGITAEGASTRPALGRPRNTELQRRVRELRATKPKPISWARLKLILDRETGESRAISTYRGYAENS